MELPLIFVTAVGVNSPHLSAHGFSATEQQPLHWLHKKNHRESSSHPTSSIRRAIWRRLDELVRIISDWVG
jgi:hypothetical protein